MALTEQTDEKITPWLPYVVDAPGTRVTPSPSIYDVVVERGLRIPMRDGTELSAMLWLPKAEGPFPALVERGPHRQEERTGPAGEYHAARGYAVLSVGLRGCSGSDGKFIGPIPGSLTGDGYDTIEWTADQPWCSGRVGMICGSISGLTQYQTVVEAPPHLTSLLVREGLTGYIFTRNAGPELLTLQFVAAAWSENQLEHYSPEERAKAQKLVTHWQQGLREAQEAAPTDSPFLPVPEMLWRLPLHPNPLFVDVADYYNDWIVPPDEERWRDQADLTRKADQVEAPICHLGGWFDAIVPHTIAAYAAMTNRAATDAARDGQRLIIGPWVHGPMATNDRAVGLLEFGPNAQLDFFAFRQRWYDAQLSGEGDLGSDPNVWLYLTGPDRWLGFEDWPPPSLSTNWYLDADRLVETAPSGVQEPDSYTYDPDDPIPTLAGGGAMGIGLDQRPLEPRLLVYTSSPLQDPRTLIGPVKSVLYASSSAPDTDWIVRLTMVRPDGASVILSGGVLRARYRRSRRQPALLEPGQAERFEIEMLPISIVIPAGCSLRFTVTSSDFPAFARNLNTGGPIGVESEGQVAVNSVFHDHARSSHVVLPVLK